MKSFIAKNKYDLKFYFLNVLHFDKLDIHTLTLHNRYDSHFFINTTK